MTAVVALAVAVALAADIAILVMVRRAQRRIRGGS